MAGCGKYAILPLFWRPHGRTTRYRYAAKGNSPDLYLVVQQQPRANGPPAGHMANGAPPRQGPPSGPPAPRPRPTSYAGAAGGARSVHHAWSSIICLSSRCLVRAVGFQTLQEMSVFSCLPGSYSQFGKKNNFAVQILKMCLFKHFCPSSSCCPALLTRIKQHHI